MTPAGLIAAALVASSILAFVAFFTSQGHTEAETDSLPALYDLMAIANRLSIGLSKLSTFAEMPMLRS